MFKLLAGVGLMLLLLCRPVDAANGAREGLCQWYYVVAPSLFPFMALMSLLTCPEASRFYDAALGGLTRRVFGLPGSAASPMVVGMLAGSPAGCAAVRNVAAQERYTRGEAERVAIACCGMSPAFFISAVGAGMLGDVGLGHVLLRSQAMSQLVMLGVTRLFCRDDERVRASANSAENRPVPSIINVAGYMALFGAIAGALGRPEVQLAMDVTAGARLLCGLNMAMTWKLPALSMLAGWGGACVIAQNIGVLRDCGVNPVKLVCARALAGMLAAGITAIQMRLDWTRIPAYNFNIVNISCIMGIILAIPAIFTLKKIIF